MEFVSNVYTVNNSKVIQCNIRDITDRKRAEEAAYKMSNELQLIFKNMINAFIIFESVFDENGKFVSFCFGSFNDAYARISGLKMDEVSGKDVFEVWPGTEQSWVDVYGKVAVTGIPNTFDMYHEPTKGWYHCYAYRPTDSTSQICVIFEDITAEKKADEELKSIAKFPGENPNPVIRISNGAIIYSNKASDQVLTAWEGKLPGDVLMKTNNALNTGLTEEADIVCGDRIFSVQFVPIADADYINLYFRDITDRIEVEEKLHQHEYQYNSILTTTMDGFCLTGMDGRIVDSNDRLYEILEYSRDELHSMSIWDIEVVEDLQSLEKRSSKIELVGFDRFETRYMRKNGNFLDVEISVNYMPQEKKYIYFIRDLTDNKRLESQLFQSQKMESVGRLAGGVAHDFNNILTVIIANAEIAAMSIPDGYPVKEEIYEIGKAAERAANLTRQLLAFSRKQVMEPKVFNMNSLILDMDKMFQRLIGENIELTTLFSDTPCIVKADPGQIEQVVTNLIVNSRDAMPDGGKLIIETKNVYLDETLTQKKIDFIEGDYVMVMISDTGTGMSQEVLANVFEPFYTTKEKGRGTGLGLSTCYGIIKQNNGNIYIYSEPGKGTVVKFYLPSMNGEVENLKDDSLKKSGAGGNETILIVEDEPSLRTVTARFLISSGYNVIKASNGEEALKTISNYKGHINLVITDVIMPVMGGKELSVRLKEILPGTKILFMSGYTDNSIVHDGVLEENISFIPKPFTHKSLTDKIREVLSKK